jgi:hypothetical protein
MNHYPSARNHRGIHAVGGSLADIITPTPNSLMVLTCQQWLYAGLPTTDNTVYPKTQEIR